MDETRHTSRASSTSTMSVSSLPLRATAVDRKMREAVRLVSRRAAASSKRSRAAASATPPVVSDMPDMSDMPGTPGARGAVAAMPADSVIGWAMPPSRRCGLVRSRAVRRRR
jgi:hypothetical protein